MILRNRNICGGGALMATGIFAASYSFANYPLGTMRAIGVGFMPFWLGIILVGLGLAIGLAGLRETVEMPTIRWRPLLLVPGALVVFALLVDRLGLLIAIPAVVAVATQAGDDRDIVWKIVLTAILTILTILIFRVGIGIQIPILAWTF